jgi:glutamine synthetase
VHIAMEDLEQAAAGLAERGIDVVRLGYADIIGVERGRDVLVGPFARTVADGVAFCRSVYSTTPTGECVDIAGGVSDGLPDVLAFPDLGTLRDVPWEPGLAHCIADIYNPDGSPSEVSPRNVLKRVLDRFGDAGLRPVVGPELEVFVLEPDAASPNGWRRYGDATGNVYVTGLKGDPSNFLLRTLRHLGGYGVAASAANHEYSSGQFEINLWHSEALDAADRAFLLKTAVQELARQDGKLATFMAKPFNDEGGSGFHLHVSALDEDGSPAFDGGDGPGGLSDAARHAVAGVLDHAPALAALCNPTINSYKRFGPDTLAPWLIDWGYDNRSAMIRIPPERGQASRMEVRLGDASANPYLATAAVLAGVLLGVTAKLDPPPPLEGYGYDPERSPQLPADLGHALDALEADEELIELLGPAFVATFVTYKRNELQRFAHHVTDWEFAEYAYHL